MSKFKVGDKVEVDLFGDGVYRPAKVVAISTAPPDDIYTVDVETCTAGDPNCIHAHNGYLSSNNTTRAR